MKFFVEYTIYRTGEDTLEITKCKGDPPAYPDEVLCRQNWEWDSALEDEIWLWTSWKTIVEADCQVAAIRRGIPVLDREMKEMGYK